MHTGNAVNLENQNRQHDSVFHFESGSQAANGITHLLAHVVEAFLDNFALSTKRSHRVTYKRATFVSMPFTDIIWNVEESMSSHQSVE